MPTLGPKVCKETYFRLFGATEFGMGVIQGPHASKQAGSAMAVGMGWNSCDKAVDARRPGIQDTGWLFPSTRRFQALGVL